MLLIPGLGVGWSPLLQMAIVPELLAAGSRWLAWPKEKVMNSPTQVPASSFPARARQSRGASWALLGFLAIAGFFLFAEHRAHVFGALPYLLLLACPFMHFFMHRGHDGHHAGHGGARPGADEPKVLP